ncbi:MAG TPA: hypothetical protein VN937_04760 [Blastocatellia bacterium]|nr:hypothetical protein [Blastocatellia bacterium]
MPLSENVRIEVYVPDLPTPSYRDLLDTLEREFTYTFGGCTIVRGLDGSYLSQAGLPMEDKVNIIFTDLPLSLDQNFERLSRYIENLQGTAFAALEEESILVTAFKVYHAELS